MKKTGKRIKHTRAASPMIVACHLNPHVAGRDRVAVMSLTQGWSTLDHLNILLETQRMLASGAEMKQDSEALQVAQFADIAMKSIRDRLKRTGKIGATGEEQKALRMLADY